MRITIRKVWETEVETEVPDDWTVQQIADHSRSLANTKHFWESTIITDATETEIFNSN